MNGTQKSSTPAAQTALSHFRRGRSAGLLDRAHGFSAMLEELKSQGAYPTQYRLELLGPIDHEITVRDPFTKEPKRLTCFDSNSYLGLHLHPRVVLAARRVLDEAGYGTPSAQLLAGNNRWLHELEETVAQYHSREAALVFPSGYSANIGILTALLRKNDFAARDRFCHASIHDGCRFSGARGGTFAHRDPQALSRFLATNTGNGGSLVVTDGVFSMHGSVAPLPGLRSAADKAGALLMVDEAHATGVLGRTGRGTEEHFGMPGKIDVLMGTFSKSAGSVGGYVAGSRVLIDYLRFFARAAVFTASLPSCVCAGITEAFRVMDAEPQLRERLFSNKDRLVTALKDLGVSPISADTPIISIVVGSQETLLLAGRDLYVEGIRCGSVSYPAVPPDSCLLRVTVNARHTDDELDRTAEAIARIAARHNFPSRPFSSASSDEQEVM